MWGEPEFMRSFFRGKMNQSRIFKKDSRLSWSLLTQEECKLDCTYRAGKLGLGVRLLHLGFVLPLAAQTATSEQRGQCTPEVHSVTFNLPKQSLCHSTTSQQKSTAVKDGFLGTLKNPQVHREVSSLWAACPGQAMGHLLMVQAGQVVLISSQGVHSSGRSPAKSQNFKQLLFHLLCLKDHHLAAWTGAPWKLAVSKTLPLFQRVFFWIAKKPYIYQGC